LTEQSVQLEDLRELGHLQPLHAFLQSEQLEDLRLTEASKPVLCLRSISRSKQLQTVVRLRLMERLRRVGYL
jgi:hypothetical protein